FYHYFKNPLSAMRTYREDDFQLFLHSRKKLLNYQVSLGIDVDLNKADEEFVERANEFILMSIKNNRMDMISKVINNAEFQQAFSNINPTKLHVILLQKAYALGLKGICLLIYRVWA